MKTHRRIIRSVGLAAVLSAASPLAAHASPLLSGYGGPGQGSQAILGSTLLPGPGGGSGSSGSGAGAERSASGEAGSGSASLAATARAAGSGTPSGARSAGARHSSARTGAPSTASLSPGARLAQAAAAAAASYRALERGAAAPSGTPLGLSGTDFAYVAVALLAVLLTGALTRQMARGRPLKGEG